MWWSLAAAGISALTGALSARRANKKNQKLYEETKRYNSPLQQMSRFRAAGLNPNLIYTQKNEAGPAPAWQSPNFDFSSIANVPNELNTYQNIKESESRVDNLKQQNKLLDSQILSMNIQNYFDAQIKPRELAFLNKQIDQIDKNIANIDWEQNFKEEELTLRGQELFWKNVFAYLDLQQREKELQQKIKEFSVNSQWQLEVNKLINWLTKNGNLNLAQAVPLATKELAINIFDSVVSGAKNAWNNLFGDGNNSNYRWNINNLNK